MQMSVTERLRESEWAGEPTQRAGEAGEPTQRAGEPTQQTVTAELMEQTSRLGIQTACVMSK